MDPRIGIRRVLAFLAVAFAFYPYAAVDVGSNTNVPLSCTFAVGHIVLCSRPALPKSLAVFLLAPLVGAFAVYAAGTSTVNGLIGSILFIVWAIPAALIVNCQREGELGVVVIALRLGLILSGSYAIFQSWALANRWIPLRNLYQAAGYPPIDYLYVAIIKYNPRPFGLFPEPSFLAGTMVLASMTLLLIRIKLADKSTAFDTVAVLVALSAAVLTSSGAAALCLPAVVYLHYRARRKLDAISIPGQIAPARLIVAAVVAVGIWAGSNIIGRRLTGGGWSWGDRYASTVGVIRYLLTNDAQLFIGLGRDTAAYLLSKRLIPLDDLVVGYYPRGVYSVLVHYAVEGGILFGVLPIVFLLSNSIGRSRPSGPLVAAASGACWTTVAALAVSYDTATYIWISLGALLLLTNSAPLRSGRPSAIKAISTTRET